MTHAPAARRAAVHKLADAQEQMVAFAVDKRRALDVIDDQIEKHALRSDYEWVDKLLELRSALTGVRLGVIR